MEPRKRCWVLRHDPVERDDGLDHESGDLGEEPAVDAIERYLMHSGDTPSDWNRAAQMFDDLAELFEQAAADGTPVRDIVGDDPLEFVETFVRTYSDGGWIAKERERLRKSIDRASGEEQKDA